MKSIIEQPNSTVKIIGRVKIIRKNTELVLLPLPIAPQIRQLNDPTHSISLNSEPSFKTPISSMTKTKKKNSKDWKESSGN